MSRFRPTRQKVLFPILLILGSFIPEMLIQQGFYGILSYPLSFIYHGPPFVYIDNPWYITPIGALVTALVWGTIFYVASCLRGGISFILALMTGGLYILLSRDSGRMTMTLAVWALLFAGLHFLCAAIYFRRVSSRGKWILLLVSLPLLVLTVDDVGRLLDLLDMPSFRILS